MEEAQATRVPDEPEFEVVPDEPNSPEFEVVPDEPEPNLQQWPPGTVWEF